MRVLEKFTKQLTARKSLIDEEVTTAVEELTKDTIPAGIKAEFLSQLAHKGETVEEIAAFARALLAKAVLPNLDGSIRTREILDVVGTGGDHLGTFNISTTPPIICAAACLL